MVITWPAANLLQGEDAVKMTFLFLVDSKYLDLPRGKRNI